MQNENDDKKSSGALRLKKSYATSFEGAHIQTVIVGDYVFEKVDKKPEDVLNTTQEDEAAKLARSVVKHVVITREKIGRCIQAIQKFFWGSSCYAIVFCVLRDKFNHGNNMKRLEEDIQAVSKELHLDFACPENTISNTFYHNKFMRYHIDKWEGHQAKKRVTRLANDVFDTISQIL